MIRTLEQRVQALESGELERLRGLAQRRLERLRQERAAVADLRERLDAARVEVGMALDKSDKRMRQLLSERADHVAELGLLRVTVQGAPDATPHEVIVDAIDHVKHLRELIDDEREESAKEIGRLRDELSDTRSHLKDALEELAEANAKLAAVTALKPSDEAYNTFRCLLALTIATKQQLSVWYSPRTEAWGAALGEREVYDRSPSNALVALSEKLR